MARSSARAQLALGDSGAAKLPRRAVGLLEGLLELRLLLVEPPRQPRLDRLHRRELRRERRNAPLRLVALVALRRHLHRLDRVAQEATCTVRSCRLAATATSTLHV